MATASQADITATPEWVDATAANAALAGADVLIQNVGRDVVNVVFAGASAPTDKSGIALGPRDSVQGNAANIWIRGGGTVSVALI
jgi:hypothetical protein